jgi:hypothetical protein
VLKDTYDHSCYWARSDEYCHLLTDSPTARLKYGQFEANYVSMDCSHRLHHIAPMPPAIFDLFESDLKAVRRRFPWGRGHEEVAEGHKKAMAEQHRMSRLGAFTVTVVSGKQLVAMDVKKLSSSSDPYVTLSLAGATKKTGTKRKTLDPEWGEKFVFEYKYEAAGKAQEIQVACFDWDAKGEDDVMGGAVLELRHEMIPEGQREVELEVPLG